MIHAMKQALDCLQAAYNLQQIDELIPPHAPVKQAITSLRQAIEATEKQEPFVVRHYSADERPIIKGNGFDGLCVGDDRDEAQQFVDWINQRIYTHPPKREWVGLTDEEMEEIWNEKGWYVTLFEKVEAKLKQKNGL